MSHEDARSGSPASLGGLCWLGQAAVNQYDAAEAAVNALYWGGVALILVALVGLGAGAGLGLPVAARARRAAASRSSSGRSSRSCTQQASDNIVDGGLGLSLALLCAAGAARRGAPRTS